MTAGAPTIGGLKRLSNYLAGQLKSAVSITGGAIDGTVIGGTTPAAGTFTTVTATSINTTSNMTCGLNFKRSVSNALTATGTTRADALQLTKDINRLTTVASGTGVILPAAAIGQVVLVFNNGANVLKVYGNGSDTIDGTAGSTGVTLTNALRCIYVCVAANTYVSAQLGVVSA